MAKPDDPPPVLSVPKRRMWLRVLVGVIGVFAVLVACSLWLLTHLDQPWVKEKVEQALSRAVGTEVSYERLSVSPFSGLEAGGFVLATPEGLRGYAPEMLRLDELVVPIELGPLLSGEIVVPEIRGGALTVTVVLADDGRTSFGELAGSEDATETDDSDPQATPLSRSLDALEGLSLRVGPVSLAPIVARVIQVSDDAVTSDSRLDALALASEGISLGETLDAALSLGPYEGDQVTLTVREAGTPGSNSANRQARLTPRVQVQVDPDRTVASSLMVEVIEQSLFPELRPVRDLLRVETNTHFAPGEATTTLELRQMNLLDSVLVASAHAVVHDDYTTLLDAKGLVEATSLPWDFPWLSIDDLSSHFEVSELAIGPKGVTGGHAKLDGTLGAADFEAGPASYEIRSASWSGEISGPASSSGMLGMLEVVSAIDRLRIKERGVYSASLERLSTVLDLQSVGTDDTGMLGLKGMGSLHGSIDRVFVDAGTRVQAREAALDLDVDLAKHRVEGRVPVRSLVLRPPGSEPITMRRAALTVLALEPLRWRTDEGAPSIEIDASVGRVSLGDKHFRARAWAFDLGRSEPERYALRTRISADRVSWGKFQKDAESSLTIDGSLDSARRELQATAALSIAGGSLTALDLSASHGVRGTHYALELTGSEAGPMLGWLLFDDGGQSGDALDFSLKSRGDFRGLLYEDQSGSLALSKEPLRTLRGTHESEFRVERAALTRRGVTHAVEDLRLTTKSTHEAPGRGRLEAEIALGELRYGEAGWELTLREYSHHLQAAYAALYGAPSFAIETRGMIGEMRQPYFRQYPLENATFGAKVDVDDTRVVAVREAYFRNPAGGTRFEAHAAYEGWQEALREREVCTAGIEGCPEVVSMYGRESALIAGTFEQDFGFWQSTERTKSSGSFAMPFTIESGDLNTYRVIASAELRDVMLELPQYGLLIDDLDALIPIEQEITTTPRLFVVRTASANAMAQKRFFDLYPFTKRESFFTVNRIQFGQETLGPMAANLQVVGSSLAMDQLHAAYRGGFITGQILGDFSRDDAKVGFRGNVTGVEATDGKGVLDANVAMTFVPSTLILEGKAQVVRISKDHLYEVLDVLDPYRENEDLNRVRLGLKFGYPKFVLVKMDEGLMNAKIELGGLAGAVRIDEIKGIPVTPFIEQYVQPYIERLLSPSAAARAMIVENEGT
jgi:hypothetical protein